MYKRGFIMYLHLGQNTIVPEKDVVGIFDLDNTTSSKITRDYLNLAEKQGLIISITDDLPKSFVVCEHNGEVRIYLSQLAPKTLAGRQLIS